jgi:hypothetical protein
LRSCRSIRCRAIPQHGFTTSFDEVYTTDPCPVTPLHYFKSSDSWPYLSYYKNKRGGVLVSYITINENVVYGNITYKPLRPPPIEVSVDVSTGTWRVYRVQVFKVRELRGSTAPALFRPYVKAMAVHNYLMQRRVQNPYPFSSDLGIASVHQVTFDNLS